jgi:hypothetical protein
VLLLHVLAAATDSPTNWLQFVRDGGVIGLLIVIVIGNLRQWWVPNWVYQDAVRDRDEWKQLALSGTAIAEKSANALEHVSRKAARR